MTISLMMFWFNIVAASISGVAGHSFWCVVNIVLTVLMALMAMGYEGRLLNHVKKLEEETEDSRRGSRLWSISE